MFWHVIKDDLMAMFHDFHDMKLPLHSLNFGIITLLPKQEEARKIQQYRPICLLNVSFKIFTKVIANRVALVAQKVIRPSQTAFLPGRNIMEGVVILHETIHEIHRKRRDGVILKLDFEKAYDKVDWRFLQQTLKMKGFSPKWCEWIDMIVRGGSVAVKVNEDMENFFQTKEGLRQGDPLSPILFNLVADMLALLMHRANEQKKIRGLVPYLVDDGLSILQYADDTILFMEHDLEEARNLKLVLSTFEKLSGLKINFHKSELFCFGKANEVMMDYVKNFGCDMGKYPFKYLGIPMHHKRISNKDWQAIEDRFQKKLSSWKGKHLSVGGRLVLINSVLSSLAMFMLSFFEIPKGILKKLDYYRSRFFWQCDENKKKYRLAKWSVLCSPKECGGLGIQNLETQNRCLLSKWLFQLINEEGVWQTLLRRKYLSNKTITQVERSPGDSHFWGGLMEVKRDFLSFRSWVVHDGTQVRFWEDCWCGDTSFDKVFPTLYSLVRRRNVSVAGVLSTLPLNVSFRRALIGDNRRYWYQLVAKVCSFNLSEQSDSFKWRLKGDGTFSVNSMYKAIMYQDIIPRKSLIWKLRIPLKIKIFLWYMQKGVMLTKDNMAKRKWKGSTKCCFCSSNENIHHLFLECRIVRYIWSAIHITFGIPPPNSVAHLFGSWLNGLHPKLRCHFLGCIGALCWALWLCRNDEVFHGTKINSFMQVIFRGTHWARQWALLLNEEDGIMVKKGCMLLEANVMDFFSKQGWNFRGRLQA